MKKISLANINHLFFQLIFLWQPLREDFQCDERCGFANQAFVEQGFSVSCRRCLSACFQLFANCHVFSAESFLLTLAELKFGVENSEHLEKNKMTLDNFLSGVQILPIFHSLDLYAKEKARLRKAGTPIDNFTTLLPAQA